MGKANTSWIKWSGLNHPTPTSDNIESLRAKINEALEELSLTIYPCQVNIHLIDNNLLPFDDTIIKQCRKDLRKAGFSTELFEQILFIRPGLRMSIWG